MLKAVHQVANGERVDSVELHLDRPADRVDLSEVPVVLESQHHVVVERVADVRAGGDGLVELLGVKADADGKHVEVHVVGPVVIQTPTIQDVDLGLEEEGEVSIVEAEPVPEREDGGGVTGVWPVHDQPDPGTRPPPVGDLEPWSRVEEKERVRSRQEEGAREDAEVDLLGERSAPSRHDDALRVDPRRGCVRGEHEQEHDQEQTCHLEAPKLGCTTHRTTPCDETPCLKWHFSSRYSSSFKQKSRTIFANLIKVVILRRLFEPIDLCVRILLLLERVLQALPARTNCKRQDTPSWCTKRARRWVGVWLLEKKKDFFLISEQTICAICTMK